MVFYNIKNVKSFACDYLGYPSSEKINRLKKENTSPSYEILSDISNKFENISAEWLLTGKGNMTSQKDDNKPAEKMIIREPSIDYVSENLISIPVVDISAAAGYGYFNPDTVVVENNVVLPKSMFCSGGLRYCVRVKGQSMTPTLQDSDYIIVRLLDKSEWLDMKDERVYLVVDKDGAAYVKRVKNRLSNSFIVLTSDSLEKHEYPNFNLQVSEIHNIFYAEWHLSAKMQNMNETYYSRLKLVEDDVELLKNQLKISAKQP